MTTIGDQLKTWLANSEGWGSADVAKAVRCYPGGENVQRQHIDNLLNNTVQSPRFLPALARVMGTTTDALHAGVAVPESQASASESVTNGTQWVPSQQQPIPTYMPFTKVNLRDAVKLLGSILESLDGKSRKYISPILADLALTPEDADDLADRAVSQAKARPQRIARNAALNEKLTRVDEFADTGRPPIGRH